MWFNHFFNKTSNKISNKTKDDLIRELTDYKNKFGLIDSGLTRTEFSKYLISKWLGEQLEKHTWDDPEIPYILYAAYKLNVDVEESAPFGYLTDKITDKIKLSYTFTVALDSFNDHVKKYLNETLAPSYKRPKKLNSVKTTYGFESTLGRHISNLYEKWIQEHPVTEKITIQPTNYSKEEPPRWQPKGQPGCKPEAYYTEAARNLETYLYETKGNKQGTFTKTDFAKCYIAKWVTRPRMTSNDEFVLVLHAAAKANEEAEKNARKGDRTKKLALKDVEQEMVVWEKKCNELLEQVTQQVQEQGSSSLPNKLDIPRTTYGFQSELGKKISALYDVAQEVVKNGSLPEVRRIRRL